MNVMRYIDIFLIVSSLLTVTLLSVLSYKINQQLKSLNEIREFLAKSKDNEFDHKSMLMARLGEIQNIRFSSYFKNRGV